MTPKRKYKISKLCKQCHVRLDTSLFQASTLASSAQGGWSIVLEDSYANGSTTSGATQECVLWRILLQDDMNWSKERWSLLPSSARSDASFSGQAGEISYVRIELLDFNGKVMKKKDFDVRAVQGNLFLLFYKKTDIILLLICIQASATRHVFKKEFDVALASEANLALAQNWAGDCAHQHERCRPEIHALPTRVLDLGISDKNILKTSYDERYAWAILRSQLLLGRGETRIRYHNSRDSVCIS
jgi:hypothetical protein